MFKHTIGQSQIDRVEWAADRRWEDVVAIGHLINGATPDGQSNLRLLDSTDHVAVHSQKLGAYIGIAKIAGPIVRLEAIAEYDAGLGMTRGQGNSSRLKGTYSVNDLAVPIAWTSKRFNKPVRMNDLGLSWAGRHTNCVIRQTDVADALLKAFGVDQ